MQRKHKAAQAQGTAQSRQIQGQYRSEIADLSIFADEHNICSTDSIRVAIPLMASDANICSLITTTTQQLLIHSKLPWDIHILIIIEFDTLEFKNYITPLKANAIQIQIKTKKKKKIILHKINTKRNLFLFYFIFLLFLFLF